MRRSVGLALSMTMVLSTVVAPLAHATSLQQAQSQEKQTAAQLHTAQAQYYSDLTQVNAAQGAVGQADVRLQAAAENLDMLVNELNAAQAELATLKTEVKVATAKVAGDQGLADQGLVLIDEHGSVSFLNVLLGANSFGGFLTRMSYLQKIWGLEVGYLRIAQAAQAHLQLLQGQQQQTVQRLDTLNTQAAAAVRQLSADQELAVQAYTNAQNLAQQANGIVIQLASTLSSEQAEIAAIVKALQSGSVPWSTVLQDIDTLAKQFGISPLLVEAVVLVESGGASNAKSPVGAEGLMQLMPGTAAGLGVKDAYDPKQNLQGGIEYLLAMLSKFHGNLSLALAAYNAGPYAVQEYGGIPPYTQTQNYVQDVLHLYNTGR